MWYCSTKFLEEFDSGNQAFFFSIIIVVAVGTECCQSYAWKQLGRYSGVWVEFSGPGDLEPREVLPHSLTRE